jgi:hemolysin III
MSREVALAAPARLQSLGEEIANSISHGVGAFAASVAGLLLVVSAAEQSDAAAVVGASVFAATMVLLYVTSTLYHALPPGNAKQVFRVLDHSAIYLLIAGTYTPFTLGVLRGAWGWSLFGVVWGLAFFGIVLKAVGSLRHPWISTALYLAMGWLCVIAVQPLRQFVPLSGLLWLAAGGLAYTLGVAFYAAQQVRYAHLVWHLFVLAGTACHFFAVLWYA